MSFERMHKVAIFLINIGFNLTARQKKVARETLSIAFDGEKTPEEIDAIFKKCFYNLGKGMVEMAYFLSHAEESVDKTIVEGQEHLDAAMKAGKGVIAVTAHFGNFPLMMMSFGQKGYKTNSIIRPARDAKMEAFLLKRRTETGLNTVYALPRQRCVSQSLKCLRKNELLFIPLDQNFGNGSGVYVNFFGQKAATATGPVVFAQRTGATILPMFIVRQEDDKHRIYIEPPIVIEEREDDDATLLYNTSRITQLIERYVRRFPHEWGWMHRRWKSKPAPWRKNIVEA